MQFTNEFILAKLNRCFHFFRTPGTLCGGCSSLLILFWPIFNLKLFTIWYTHACSKIINLMNAVVYIQYIDDKVYLYTRLVYISIYSSLCAIISTDTNT